LNNEELLQKIAVDLTNEGVDYIAEKSNLARERKTLKGGS
jgi:hypothetical protein